MNMRARGRQDARVTLVALTLLLAWDASALDLSVARLFGTGHGFDWRDTWWATTALHQGGRLLAILLLLGMGVAALRAPRSGEPPRALRWRWVAVVVLCLLVVPAIKRVSPTSCPWELAEFGGAARYLSHWRWQLADGGPGHCFPSGHAVAAFAFIGLYFQWRDHAPRRARTWLWAVLAAGVLLGSSQLARGAHYPSHTLWSAWLCWLICVSTCHLSAVAGRVKPQTRPV